MPNPKRILVVDDETANCELLETMLSGLGYEVEIAFDGFQALSQLHLDYDLVVLDVMMPGMDGFEVVRKIREGDVCSDIPICMATALSGKEDRLRAVEAGANDFISKPVDLTELRVRVASLVRIKEGQDAIKRHQADLEANVAQRTESLRLALKETAEAKRNVFQAQLETIERLALAAEYKDEDTAFHVKRMGRYSHLIALKLGLSPHECETILYSSPMHDVGKIGIPDSILLKPGKLDAKEWEIMKTHAEIGAMILGGSSSHLLQAGEIIALNHHEKWDGSGYPGGLSGENIPLWGRIAAIADVFDALTSKRPYKDPFPDEKAIAIMSEGRGSHFDPRLLDLFLGNLEEVFAIRSIYKEPDL